MSYNCFSCHTLIPVDFLFVASPRLMVASKNGITGLPGAAKVMKLKELSVRCNMRLWLPLIQGFSSLEMLYLVDDGQSVSSTQPLNLSKLYNLEDLTILDCTSIGSSILKIPVNLKYLRLFNYSTLEQLPDLCSLKQLRTLDIGRCINLQSLPQLPPHLEELKVDECASLQDVPELSMLKELRSLSFSRCSTLKSINIQETSLMVCWCLPLENIFNSRPCKCLLYIHVVCYDTGRENLYISCCSTKQAGCRMVQLQKLAYYSLFRDPTKLRRQLLWSGVLGCF